MRRTSPRARLAVWALALGLALAGGPRPAAAEEVIYDACVVYRRPTSALMSHVLDRALFEVDLRLVPDSPFALLPDDCVRVTGRDRGNEPGLRREFPQAGWVIEAWAISEIRDHVNRGSPAGNQD